MPGAADPKVNEKFLDPGLNAEEWVKRFEGESREVFAQRAAIVKASGVGPGQVVADVGAGTGLFTFLFADAVGPKGRVYAVDVSPVFVRRLRQQAKTRALRNVVVIQGASRSPELPEGAVDRVFICDTYHHFEHPGEMLAGIARALRPGGEVVVVDFRREPGKSSAWTLEHVRAGEEVVKAEFQAAGFSFERSADFLQENYLLVFKKVADRKAPAP